MRNVDYKWIALSNTTLGTLMAGLDGTIVLIALPAIFRGIGVNPLEPAEIGYMLWMLLGFMVVTAVFLVTFGRISDMYGRVRLYNAGFAIFTLGSILLSLVGGHGNGAALELILFRLVQGVGAGFLFSNSAAILVDAFPANERGMALGVNQIAAVGGSLIGLVMGGILATINWHWIFLVNVPIGLFGTVWAYLMLKEKGSIQKGQRLDLAGNATFAIGLTVLLLGITYALLPYGSSPMGWRNPEVIAALGGGVVLLAVFAWVETRVPQPMFRLTLFKSRPFWAGNLSGFLASLARGGLQFMLVIWLQGIWLPLHGYSFEQTPLWSGIYMIPMMVGFSIMGPVSGHLSDRYGARGFATTGMGVTAVAFVALMALPANFTYPIFAVILLFMGFGMGMFAAPNTASIMNAVPKGDRGAASGMRATLQNAATMFSMGVFFTIVTIGLASHLPAAMFSGLTGAGLPAAIAHQLANLPPTSALFAAFLGYNPMATLVPASVLATLPAAGRAALLGTTFFPGLISPPFMAGLRDAFLISAAMAVIAGLASVMRGGAYIHRDAEDEDAPGAAEAATEAMQP
ncbi:MAG TPA: MFS transporter [Bacillota bacterium]|nr:MFS transporter [Bacillota bacterium]